MVASSWSLWLAYLLFLWSFPLPISIHCYWNIQAKTTLPHVNGGGRSGKAFDELIARDSFDLRLPNKSQSSDLFKMTTPSVDTGTGSWTKPHKITSVGNALLQGRNVIKHMFSINKACCATSHSEYLKILRAHWNSHLSQFPLNVILSTDICKDTQESLKQ